VELGNRRYQTLPMVLPTTLDIRCGVKSCCTLLSYCEYTCTPFSRRPFLAIGNESAPIQLVTNVWSRFLAHPVYSLHAFGLVDAIVSSRYCGIDDAAGLDYGSYGTV